jgi:LmbE family N-acetylglucosaminyl deacetylase
MINRLVILSPHFDDAIFSVGGLLAAWRSRCKSMIVVNIFTSNPPKELTPQANLFHSRYMDKNPVAIRCMLDQRAYSHFDIEIINLDFLDAIYRFDVINKRPNYLDPIDIFSTVNAIDTYLAVSIFKSIEQQFKLTNEDVILSPLGVGGHVDHEITRLAAENFERPLILYYEDCPYSFQPTIRSSRRALTIDMYPLIVPIDSNCISLKIKAIKEYNTPVSTNCFVNYMAEIKPEGYAERLWAFNSMSQLF